VQVGIPQRMDDKGPTIALDAVEDAALVEGQAVLDVEVNKVKTVAKLSPQAIVFIMATADIAHSSVKLCWTILVMR
jgi:hypothetical protein